MTTVDTTTEAADARAESMPDDAPVSAVRTWPRQRAYGFDHLPTEDEVTEVSDRWRPFRSLAVGYLLASEYEGEP